MGCRRLAGVVVALVCLAGALNLAGRVPPWQTVVVVVLAVGWMIFRHSRREADDLGS